MVSHQKYKPSILCFKLLISVPSTYLGIAQSHHFYFGFSQINRLLKDLESFNNNIHDMKSSEILFHNQITFDIFNKMRSLPN